MLWSQLHVLNTDGACVSGSWTLPAHMRIFQGVCATTRHRLTGIPALEGLMDGVQSGLIYPLVRCMQSPFSEVQIPIFPASFLPFI